MARLQSTQLSHDNKFMTTATYDIIIFPRNAHFREYYVFASGVDVDYGTVSILSIT